MTMISTIDEMARFFDRTRNAVVYQIKLGRLADPRFVPIDSQHAVWPKGEKRGRKPGESPAKANLVNMVNSLLVRIVDLENRVATQESLSRTQGE